MLAKKGGFLMLILIQLVFPKEVIKLVKLSRSSFGHTYITRTVRSVIMCSSECLKDGHCNSLTFADHNNSCELNNRSPADFPYTNVEAVPNKNLYYIKADPCPEAWLLYHRHCYLVIIRRGTWKDREENCQTMGAHLSDITDNFENTFIQEVAIQAGALKGGSLMWLGWGSYFNATSYNWTSGRGVEYTNFRLGHMYVTGDCIAIGYHGLWNVVSCETILVSVCKKRHY